MRIHRQSKKDKRQTKKIFMLYDGPYVIKEIIKPNVYLIADQESEVVGVYNSRQIRPHREPILRTLTDRRETALENVDDAESQESSKEMDHDALDASVNAEPIRYELRPKKGQLIREGRGKSADRESNRRSIGRRKRKHRRKRRWTIENSPNTMNCLSCAQEKTFLTIPKKMENICVSKIHKVRRVIIKRIMTRTMYK